MRCGFPRGTMAALSSAVARSHDRSPYRDPYLLAFVLASLAVGVLGLVLHYGVFRGSSGPGAILGSGIAATDVRAVPAFDGVELRGSNNLVVRVGPKRAVTVYADDNLLGRVTTRVEGGALVVGNRAGSFTTRSPMYVEITTPSLRSVVLSGSGVVRASGRAASLDVALTGSGDAQLEQLVAREVTVVVSGSGRAVVTATRALDASVTGSGVIVYGGNPLHVTSSVTGVGAIGAR
jgi:putative autotransporter adhesin-like protein